MTELGGGAHCHFRHRFLGQNKWRNGENGKNGEHFSPLWRKWRENVRHHGKIGEKIGGENQCRKWRMEEWQ